MGFVRIRVAADVDVRIRCIANLACVVCALEKWRTLVNYPELRRAVGDDVVGPGLRETATRKAGRP